MQFIDLQTQYQLIKTDIQQAINNVLEHGQYIMGPEVEQLEAELASYVGVKHCVGVASGTDALLIALMALDIKAGDEIITTPFTFISTGEVIALLGAKPVFIDIDPKTYNLDPSLIEQVITEKTKAIMPVSLYGQCANMSLINQIANKYSLPVIEDGAQSFGATHQGKRSGGLSTIGCTSFFPSKPLGGYGDGGACFTDNDHLAEKMRWIRIHGQNRRYHHPIVGINGRLDTIQAAIVLSKFKIFDQEVKLRQSLGANYTKLLSDYVITPYLATGNTHVYGQYTIQVEKREQVQQQLQQQGIPTAVHYPIPLNLQPAFAHLQLGENSFPIAEKIAKRVMSLPMHPYLKQEQQIKIIEALRVLTEQTMSAT